MRDSAFGRVLNLRVKKSALLQLQGKDRAGAAGLLITMCHRPKVAAPCPFVNPFHTCPNIPGSGAEPRSAGDKCTLSPLQLDRLTTPQPQEMRHIGAGGVFVAGGGKQPLGNHPRP